MTIMTHNEHFAPKEPPEDDPWIGMTTDPDEEDGGSWARYKERRDSFANARCCPDCGGSTYLWNGDRCPYCVRGFIE